MKGIAKISAFWFLLSTIAVWLYPLYGSSVIKNASPTEVLAISVRIFPWQLFAYTAAATASALALLSKRVTVAQVIFIGAFYMLAWALLLGFFEAYHARQSALPNPWKSQMTFFLALMPGVTIAGFVSKLWLLEAFLKGKMFFAQK